MIKSVKAGIAKYERALRGYVKFKKSLEKRYGRKIKDPMGELDSDEWYQVQELSSTLRGMERTLGLTRREIRRFEKAAGFTKLTGD